MKNKTSTLKTGVRELSQKKLKPLIEKWFRSDPSRMKEGYEFEDAYIWNRLAVAITTASGVQVKGSRLYAMTYSGDEVSGVNMSAKARHGLCLVLGVHEEEISEPLD